MGILDAPLPLLIGVNNWGLAGLALAWLVVSPLVCLQGMLRGLPVLGLRWGQLLGAMGPSAGASLFMVGAVAATRHWVLAGQDSLWRLCGLVGVGALAYSAVWLGLNRSGAREILNLIKNIATVKPQTL